MYFMVSCWGCYINIQPLTSLKGAQTAEALVNAVTFFRSKGIILDDTRMDNQTSPELRAAAIKLGLTKGLVSSNQKEANRSERAIQTAKSHIIATRAGFHRDCPHTFVDKMIPQMEMSLNTLHPYEYNPKLSAYEGIYGESFDFMTHPIAPAGSKVLTWDSPTNRGSWADHGTEGIYVGPALDHFRAFEIWVPQNSAMRVSSTVWWFFPTFAPDDNLVTLQDPAIS
jgi:hypothetical protein